MALFQHSVLVKYLKDQDQQKIDSAYIKFKEYFHNPEIQQNIRESKEEQFQEGFLRELFVKILGYTINPKPDFNLTTEFKNEKGAKKADGAVLLDGKALGVIELKGTETKDLDKINAQAFNYKNNQSACIYVITSNFEKLRFFIHNAVENIEFNLFTLTLEEFTLLWLCLNVENLFKGIPLKVKEESLLEEEKITKQLYKDYAAFRMELWQNMVNKNPQLDKLLLFKKTQKLLDRYLFIFFAEDSGLLPPNSISRIVKRWNILKEEDAYKPLYDIFKQYFGYINTGRKGQKAIDDIFAYNGGLFQANVILDNINIDDEILLKHTEKLTAYDFQSEVDVNILGHIFENSLNEIEEITTEIEASSETRGHETRGHVPLLSKTSKRKKDGVFYTPKYITKYIVDNTVGKLCEEKKTELGVVDEEYAKGRRNRKKDILKKLDENLQAYRNWLLNITICDPACGSGAFLNQALELLIDEHAYIDELQAQLFGAGLVFQDVSNHILEKNIYGVDINEESVEIAKLSLWLRTAQRGRKLTFLNKNIKCGNSLIDDPVIAGVKAFNWHKEFPAIFNTKEKLAYHITTATHDSRTSQRMIDYKVREKRDKGSRPEAQEIWLEAEDELLITKTIEEIVKEDDLNVLAYNICGDHIHLLLVCEEEELERIIGKIKAISSRKYNIEKGITIPVSSTARGHVPLSVPENEKRNKNKSYNSLWTQKFGRTEIKDEKQLWSTIEYIKNNREKHELESNKKKLQAVIDSMCCDYNHAYRTEYNGGFDVVIGNPPYVTGTLLNEEKNYLKSNFETAQYQLDLYILFIERSLDLVSMKGYVSFITPNSWLKNLMMSDCRKVLLDKTRIIKIIPNIPEVFEGVNVDSLIFIFTKQQVVSDEIEICSMQNGAFEFKHLVKQSDFLKNDKFIFTVEINPDLQLIIDKLKKDVIELENIFDITRGVNPYDIYTGQEKSIIESKAYHASNKKDETFVPELRGKHIDRYMYNWDGIHYISYGNWLAAPRNPKYFKGERIIFREILGKNFVCTYIKEEFIIDRSLYIALHTNNKFDCKYVLGLLASKLLAFYFRYVNNEFDALFPKIRLAEFKKLPIKKVDQIKQQVFVEKVNKILSLNSTFHELVLNFLNLLKSKFDILKLSKKLQNWHELEFKDFLKKLKKAKVQLSLSDEAEWMQYFIEQKQKAQDLKSEIDKTDKEIDQKVYRLYGLTEDEIKIVKNA